MTIKYQKIEIVREIINISIKHRQRVYQIYVLYYYKYVLYIYKFYKSKIKENVCGEKIFHIGILFEINKSECSSCVAMQ